jgi:hypothetical protein
LDCDGGEKDDDDEGKEDNGEADEDEDDADGSWMGNAWLEEISLLSDGNVALSVHTLFVDTLLIEL